MKDRSDNLGVDDDAENDNDTQKRPFFLYFFLVFVFFRVHLVRLLLFYLVQDNKIYHSSYIDLCLEYGWSGDYNFICTGQLLRIFFLYYCLTTLLLSNAIFLETNSPNNAILILFATLTFLMPTNTF